jgi:Skp family chaperone for outer membrane proteins
VTSLLITLAAAVKSGSSGGGIDPSLLLGIIAALGLLGGIGLGLKAVIERRALRARAGSDDASAAVAVAQAARELIDPLRQELAQERKDHAEEIELERIKVDAVHAKLDILRKDLNRAQQDVHDLRVTLRRSLEETRKYKERNVALERELRQCREFKQLNDAPQVDTDADLP